MILYFLIIAPVFLSLLMYILPFKKISYLSLLIQGIMFGISVHNFRYVSANDGAITVGIGADGIMGISLYNDIIASVFIMLITSIFFVFNIYSFNDYLKDKLFQFLFLTLEGLIILIFLSRDIFNIFVAIEVSTIICAILIMYKRDSRSIYDGLVYLMTNTAGVMFFLLGIAMLYKMFGVLDISYLKESIAGADARSLMIPYSLIMAGVCLKCAVVPVFSWLPKAHGTPGAPPLVSALLSGLYIKGGIYVYIRMRDMFSPTIDMDVFFIIVGVVTSVMGIVFALLQSDIKLTLAYSTISQVGLIIMTSSIDDAYTKAGGLLHIINHALFKSLLFLASGLIITEFKSRNIYDIRGVFRKMPIAGMAILIGIFGVTGAPLFNGSVSKYFIQSGVKGAWVEWFVILINFGTTLYFVKFGSMLLPDPVKHETVKESAPKSIALVILSFACLATGIGATTISRNLLGIDVDIKALEYIEKGFLWIGMLLVSALIYWKFFARSKFFRRGYNIELSFNDIALAIVLFFFVILGSYNVIVL